MMIIRVASATVTHRNPHDHHRLTPPLGVPVRETVEDRGPTQEVCVRSSTPKTGSVTF